MFEKALACIDEVKEQGKATRYIFTKPIPTMCGMLCRECQVCQICGRLTEEMVRCDCVPVRACLGCTDCCEECGQAKIKNHSCCVVINC